MLVLLNLTMINYKKLALYIIFMMSVYFQVYLDLYDKYMNYKNLGNFYNYNETIELIKNSTGKNSVFKNNKAHVENYFIPKQAQYVRWYLKNSQINSFRLSATITGVYNRYAIMEGAYPIQISEISPYLITTVDDTIPENCNVLDSKEGVKIVHCP